ncbi:MAG: hypothetical protein A2381_00980 [Bdellovibrionales bacterium RIFOXYB1_FULL_37_110]|nr:MAG: hypothetical protein A2417_01835 [Bdellovibrionales bacterium RIFOXYC1_FULL_37_79]OFZ58792.1 MAG: hypothetical protein A2381_00980 [Bdellovibrionales bacterium RIFOXYB1_FULL_37_110]OFZ64791.1 MAG: hypothetical protein A2577_06980 [Bdellovibrionales bacterium RIFOXYD1_FULL_36_51]
MSHNESFDEINEILPAIILVRLDSQRLPGKALLEINHTKLIEFPLKALASQKSFRPIIATSDRKLDDPLEELAKKYHIEIFRGELNNVAQRVCDCIQYYQLNSFARINGDSPFLQTDLLLKGYKIFLENQLDFITNLLPRTFPYGISLEIFNAKVFLDHMNHTKDSYHTEHITSFFYKNKDQFNFQNISMGEKIDASNVHLTVDTKQDFDFFEKMLNFDNSILNKGLDDIILLYKTLRKDSL